MKRFFTSIRSLLGRFFCRPSGWIYLFIIGVIILFFFMHSLCVSSGWNGNKFKIYDAMGPLITSLLAISVTAYVFLSSTLDRHKNKHPEEVKTIELLEKDYSHVLIFLSPCAVFFIMGWVTHNRVLYNGDSSVHKTVADGSKSVAINNYWQVVANSCFSWLECLPIYVFIVLAAILTMCLAIFIQRIIAHEKEIVYYAKYNNKENTKKIKCMTSNRGIPPPGENHGDENSGIVHTISRLESIADQLVKNHRHVLSSSITENDLRYTLIYILKNRSESVADKLRPHKQTFEPTTLVDYYNALKEFRDGLLVIARYDRKNNRRKIADQDSWAAVYGLVGIVEREFIRVYIEGQKFDDFVVSGTNWSEACLRKTDFAKSSLRNVNLEGASVDGASFRDCWLDDIKFQNATCDAADFTNARFINTDLLFGAGQKAVFSNAVFNEADLTGRKLGGETVFSYASFIGANMYDCRLEGIQMDHANCSSASFAKTRIVNPSFQHGNFSNAVFSDTSIKGNGEFRDDGMHCLRQCNFSHTTFFNSVLTGLNFKDSHFTDASFYQTPINHCCFDRSYGQNASFKLSNIKNSSFRLAQLSKADFSFALFAGVKMNHALFRDALLIGVQARCQEGKRESGEYSNDFGNVNFSGAQFLGATSLVYARMRQDLKETSESGKSNPAATSIYCRCDFSGAMFEDAYLSNVHFNKCLFAETCFIGAYIQNVEFDAACKGIKKELFKGVKYLDKSTKASLRKNHNIYL